MEARHLTQQDVADALGVKQPAVSKYLAGGALGAHRVAPLAALLDVPPGEVLEQVRLHKEAGRQPRRPAPPGLEERVAKLEAEVAVLKRRRK